MDRLLILSVTPVALLVQFASHVIATHSMGTQQKFQGTKLNLYIPTTSLLYHRYVKDLADLMRNRQTINHLRKVQR